MLMLHENKYITLSLTITCFSLLISGCIAFTKPYKYTVIRKDFNEKNPTSYVYNFPIDLVKSRVLKNYYELGSDSTCGRLSQASFERIEHSIDTLYFKVEEDDLILETQELGGFPSKIYLSEEEKRPLPYQAYFHIHYSKVDEKKTEVSIYTYKSKVRVGITSGMLNPHGPAWIFEDVPPTTIEEYYILLAIGRILGEGNMQPIILPGKEKVKSSKVKSVIDINTK